MPFLARDLISKAYYLSGIVSRQYQSVSGQQVTDGLFLLNEILTSRAYDQRTIPYFKLYTVNTVAGQETYFIPGLIDAESITFNIGTVRYSMVNRGRRKYFGDARADNVQSLPFSYHLERKLNGSDLYLYFLPNQIYPVKIWGKFGLDEVALDDDIRLVFDFAYCSYLRYQLAESICEENNLPLPPQTAKTLEEKRQSVKDISPLDLHERTMTTSGKRSLINYAYANLGTGWEP